MRLRKQIRDKRKEKGGLFDIQQAHIIDSIKKLDFRPYSLCFNANMCNNRYDYMIYIESKIFHSQIKIFIAAQFRPF